RDATLAAIAIAVYHARHGAYPPSLDVLVPDLLPALPIDRIDGKPLKYKPAPPGGLPILYSVGADRKDDGGRPPEGKNAFLNAARWVPIYTVNMWKVGDISRGAYPDGDWVFWPPVRYEAK